MIHLKIISATFPPDDKPRNSYIKIIPKHCNNSINPTAIYKTKKIKKSNNPEWNAEYYIPFYCFDSVILEFWNKKVFGESFIGKGEIDFTPESFNQKEPQKMQISPEYSSNSFQSYCIYSISSTFSSLDYQPYRYDTLKFYIYLTYNPPLKQGEEVELYIQKVDKNGSTYDKAFKEKEKVRKMGPFGLTDVYNFDGYFSKDVCFFFVKSINYTGKVTLNIANLPYPAEMDQIEQYFLFFKDVSIQVSSQKDVNFCYALFPYTFKIADKKVSLENFKLLPEICQQTVPVSSQFQAQTTDDDFLNAYNYYHSNPEGIALKSILDAGMKGICTSDFTFYYHFPIEPLKKYYLNNAFKFHEIDYKPNKIGIYFNLNLNSIFTYFVYTSGENGVGLDQFILDSKNGIETKKNEIGLGLMDRMCFFVTLDKFDKSVKYIAFLANSKKNNILNEGFIRVTDETSKRELMSLNTNNSSGKSSVLAAMLVRDDDDNDWVFWPCMQFYNGEGADNAFEFMSTFLTDSINELYQ